MSYKIGIIRETKNGETRTPFTPVQLQEFSKKYNIPVFIESSNIRCYSDSEYKKIGAKVVKKLKNCSVVFGFKEIPIERILKNGIYFCFSHIAQGQKHNLSLLEKLMQEKCSLIDYEEIDRHYKNSMRLGRYAGMVGIVETLSLLCDRFTNEKIYTMIDLLFAKPQEYENSDDIKNYYRQLKQYILKYNPPYEIPIIIGIVGNGRIANGVMEMLQCLPHKVVDPKCGLITDLDVNYIHITKFDRTYTRDASYFETYLPHLTVLINAIKWNPKDQKFVTYKSIRHAQSSYFKSKLKIISDISCDLEGPIELVHKATTFKDPYYIKNDIWITAIDNLPAGISDLAKEASKKVGDTLLSFFKEYLDLYSFFNNLNSKAIILKKGIITESYNNLKNI